MFWKCYGNDAFILCCDHMHFTWFHMHFKLQLSWILVNMCERERESSLIPLSWNASCIAEHISTHEQKRNYKLIFNLNGKLFRLENFGYRILCETQAVGTIPLVWKFFFMNEMDRNWAIVCVIFVLWKLKIQIKQYNERRNVERKSK